MNTIVVSYSLSGNNDALAGSIAKALGAEHIRIREQKNRNTGTIAVDLLLGRTPRVSPDADRLAGGDMVVFVGPVWMKCVATPFRVFFKRLREHPVPYAYVSISGGALGPNPNLAKELTKRLGMAPVSLVDMHIADLLPIEKPSMKDTGDYRLTPEDNVKLTDLAVRELQSAMATK